MYLTSESGARNPADSSPVLLLYNSGHGALLSSQKRSKSFAKELGRIAKFAWRYPMQNPELVFPCHSGFVRNSYLALEGFHKPTLSLCLDAILLQELVKIEH